MSGLTKENLAARVGKITASRFASLMGGYRRGDREEAMTTIYNERRLGRGFEKETDDPYRQRAMEHGKRREPLVISVLRERDEFKELVPNDELLVPPCMDTVGATPDAIMPPRMPLEIKSPMLLKNYDRQRRVPKVMHLDQLMFQAWVMNKIRRPVPGGILVYSDPRNANQYAVFRVRCCCHEEVSEAVSEFNVVIAAKIEQGYGVRIPMRSVVKFGYRRSHEDDWDIEAVPYAAGVGSRHSPIPEFHDSDERVALQ